MPPLSSLALRTISSAVLIPAVIALVLYGGWPYGVFIAACIGIAVAEWMSLTKLITPSFIKRALIGIAGFFYLEFSFFEMAYLRLSIPDGVHWIFYLFLAIWASDTLAYIAGKTIGGPKMTPTISPNKTWAGYAGALIGPVLVLLFSVHVDTPISLIEYTPSPVITMITGLLIGITAQSGDLLVSLMKRKAGVKDTGALIPGHGGMLDRIDSLLLILPVYGAFLSYIHPVF